MINNDAQIVTPTNLFTEIELTDEQLESISGGSDPDNRGVHANHEAHDNRETHTNHEAHDNREEHRGESRHDEHPEHRRGGWNRWHHWHWYNWY